MIRTELLTIDGRDFIRTYSDSGKYVVRDGISYEEAIDPAEFGRVYTEGDDIPVGDPTDEDYAQIGRIMMGGDAMNWIERARYLRQMIERLAEEVLEDETALEYKELFPEWQDGTDYHVGDRVRHEGTLYKCLIAHTAQSDWLPNTAVSLWAVVLIPDPDEIPEWVQPDSTNPYMKGDKVRYNGKVYESDIDNNVWSPETYGWHEVTE